MSIQIFSRGDAQAFFNHRIQQALEAVEFESPPVLESNFQAVLARLTDTFELNEVILGEATADTFEVTVNANRFADLGFHAPGQQVERPATRVRISIPFSGSCELLWYQPQTFDLAPREAMVDDGTITLERDFIDPNVDQAKAWRDQELQRLRERVGHANAGVALFNARLEGQLSQRTEARLKRLQTQQSLKDQLNQ